MTEAHRDLNNVPVDLAFDGTTTKELLVDPSTNELLVDVIVATGPFTPLATARRDENNISTEYGISSVDGTTLIPIRTDANGRILLDV